MSDTKLSKLSITRRVCKESNPPDESCFLLGETEFQVRASSQNTSQVCVVPPGGKPSYLRFLAKDKPLKHGQCLIELVEGGSNIRLRFTAPQSVAIDRKEVRRAKLESANRQRATAKTVDTVVASK
jgi:hypothetical protein